MEDHAGDQSEPELGALLNRALRTVLAMEKPILAGHGLSMWEYVVLSALSRGDIRTQAALADSIAADRTRLIAVLDALQARDLISREPDPSDRRVRLLALTRNGRRLRSAVHTDIAKGEAALMSTVRAEDAAVLRRVLAQVAVPVAG